MTGNAELLIPIVITALAPAAIWLMRSDPDRREAVSLIAGILAFISMAFLVPGVLRGEVRTFTVSTLIPGISIRFGADGLSMIFGLIATFLWIFATLYNIGYMRALKEHAQTRYYVCFAIAIFGAVGVAMSANLFTLYLYYEIITVCTYPLVAHHQDAEAYEGGKKYLVYLMGTSKLFLLPGMVIIYVVCGTLDFNR